MKKCLLQDGSDHTAAHVLFSWYNSFRVVHFKSSEMLGHSQYLVSHSATVTSIKKHTGQQNTAFRTTDSQGCTGLPIVSWNTRHASPFCRRTCSSHDKWSCDLKSKSDAGEKRDWLFLWTWCIHINPQFSEVYKQSCVLPHSTAREVN